MDTIHAKGMKDLSRDKTRENKKGKERNKRQTGARLPSKRDCQAAMKSSFDWH